MSATRSTSHSFAPSIETKSSARTNGGNARITSHARISTSSTQPRAYAATSPMIVPVTIPSAVDTAAIQITVQPPCRNREKTSRPRWSVPSNRGARWGRVRCPHERGRRVRREQRTEQRDPEEQADEHEADLGTPHPDHGTQQREAGRRSAVTPGAVIELGGEGAHRAAGPQLRRHERRREVGDQVENDVEAGDQHRDETARPACRGSARASTSAVPTPG